MAYEIVTVSAGGFQYSTWLEVEIQAGAGQAARSFTIKAAEPNEAIAAAWPFAPGTPVEIDATGDLMVTGYVDDYAPEFDKTSHTATITGRSKGADAIDCSQVHPTGRFDNQDLGQIAQALDVFGIGFTPEIPLKQIPFHQTVQGATVFQELDTLARAQGVLLVGNPDGSVSLTNASVFGMHAGALVEGVNIEKASAKLSMRKKHSSVKARGQRWKGDGKTNLRIEQEQTDSTVSRYRPLILLVEGDTDPQRAQERANWHVARQSGYATTAEVTVTGWRDSGGKLWNPKQLVYLQSGKLKIDQVMAIKQVTFTQNRSTGTTAKLSLVDPQALGGKASGGSSNAAWATGGGD